MAASGDKGAEAAAVHEGVVAAGVKGAAAPADGDDCSAAATISTRHAAVGAAMDASEAAVIEDPHDVEVLKMGRSTALKEYEGAIQSQAAQNLTDAEGAAAAAAHTATARTAAAGVSSVDVASSFSGRQLGSGPGMLSCEESAAAAPASTDSGADSVAAAGGAAATDAADSMAAAGGAAATSAADSMAAAGGAAATSAADSMAAADRAAASLSVDADMSIKVESITATAASSVADSMAAADSAAASTYTDVDMRPSVSIMFESRERVAAAAGESDDGWYMAGSTGGTTEELAHRRRFRELVASLSRKHSRPLR